MWSPEIISPIINPGRVVQDMKLNKTKVRYILRQNRKEVAIEEIARDVKVSQRRVQQIIKEYKETGQEPVFCANSRKLIHNSLK
jgi:ABC-type Zn uptake system ZnuABC Zn-binding protein ZnuA